MVQMPSSNELGARLPRASRGQPNYPSSSPVADAIQRAGGTLAQVGFSLAGQKKEENDKTVALGVQSRLLQFEDQWMTDAVNRVQNAQPGAAGFSDTFAKDYQAAARKFFTSVPDDLKPIYDQKLFEIESRLLGKARTFEREEADRYAKIQVEDGQNALLNRQAADPDQWQSVEQDGEALIRARPGATPIETDEEVRAWRKRRALQLFETRRARDEAGERGKLGVLPRVGGSLVDRIIGAESGGDPNAQNSRSSAGGAGQFIDSTWVGMIRKYRPDLAAGASNDDIIAMKTDGALSREMVGRLAQENAAGLRSAGIEASDRNLYLAHFAGVEGAKKLLSADDSTPVSSLTSQEVMDANPNLKGKTVGDLKAWADKKIGASGQTSPQQDFPIVTKGNSLTGRKFAPDLSGVQPDVMSRFKSLQNTFGASIPVVSGFRDAARNAAAGGVNKSQHIGGNALDLDVSDLSQAQRIQLIKQARAAGFGGIGVYGNSLHVDTGPQRAWGPSYHSDSVPAWAQEALGTPVGAGLPATPNTPSDGGVDYSILSDPAPEYEALSFEDRLKLFEQSLADEKRRNAERAAQDRFDIGVAETNAPVAFSQTGAYTGQMPTMEKYISAYGEQEGVQRFQQFEASVETSRKVFDMKAAPASEINQMVAEAQPISSGPAAAMEQKRYEALSSAREAILKAREADPAGYIIRTFPAVGEAFDQAAETKDYAPAVRMSIEAQRGLGIQNVQPMPKQAAEFAVGMFKDDAIPEMDRIAAISSPVMAVASGGADAADMQRAIYDQMVAAGLPDITEGAMEALARGDQAAATRLFRAAMVDVSKLPGEGPKPAEIDTAVQSRLLDEGQVGDLYYGLSDGSVENFERAQRDAKLLNNAINIRVRNGETLESATDAAAKDLFGDVKVLTGDSRVNAQVLVPSDEEEEPVLEGFAGLMPEVERSLRDSLVLPADAPTSDATKPILGAAKETFVQNVLARGVWRNVEGGFAFIDPVTGTYAKGPDGKARVFTMDEVMGNRLPPAPAFLPNDPTRTMDQNVQDEMQMQEDRVRRMYEGVP